MDTALAVAGFSLGLVASPHCALMCGAPCAALTSGCRPAAGGFHLGRLASYAAAGAVAATSVAALGHWSQAAPALRPLWTLLHLALLGLGLWWLATGRPPGWMHRDTAVSVRWAGRGGPVARTSRAALAGLAWVAWPCGALQAGLLLSALANGAPGGALVMACFALGSMPALALAPWAWSRWQAFTGRAVSGAAAVQLGYRVAGGALLAASGWALTQGIWLRFAAWCAA